MSTPNSFGRMEDDDGDDDSRSLSSCTSNNDRILAQIDGILTRSPSVPVNWNAVDGLLKELATDRESSPSSAVNKYGSAQNDPMGRLLMSGILSRNPPVNIVDATIHIFPDSLDQNPAAFLAASQKAGPEVLSRMARHISGRREQCNQCPYPWLLSNSTSVEQGKTILEAYPEGVLQPSPFLSSLDLVDHLLMVVESRTFDSALWTKFKLVLVAAGCSDKDVCSAHNCGIAPVQVILKRMLSRELGMYTVWMFLKCSWMILLREPIGSYLSALFQTVSHLPTGHRSKNFGPIKIGLNMSCGCSTSFDGRIVGSFKSNRWSTGASPYISC